MKSVSLRIVFIILLLGFLNPISSLAYAQHPGVESEESSEEVTPTIVDRIMEESEGNVEIIVDNDLLEKILKEPVSHKRGNQSQTQRIRPGINKLSGFRIQVFGDGRNQHTLEARAKARGNAISSRFPKYRGQVYTFSSSPNWYTRVGNFRTASEANAALAELRSAFPAFANEMRVVKCQIVIVK